MSKPKVPPFDIRRQAPPTVSYSFTIAQCPVCDHIAFGLVETTTPPVLVGQKGRARLAGVECPWCLTLTETDDKGHMAKTTLVPLDHAQQVRTGLTQIAEAAKAGAPDGEAAEPK